MPEKKARKTKIDKEALIYETVEQLVATSTTWAVLLEEATWPEKVFLLQSKTKIDKLIADYKSLTGR